MASRRYHLCLNYWPCYGGRSLGMDTLAPRISLLPLQSFQQGEWQGQMEHSHTMRNQHGLLCLHALHLLANYGGHAAAAIAGGSIFPVRDG